MIHRVETWIIRLPFQVSCLIQIKTGISDVFSQPVPWPLSRAASKTKKSHKYSGRELHNLYFENHTKMFKVINGDLTKRDDILYSWIAILNTVKMSIFYKFIYRFNAVSVEISADFFTETDVDPKVHVEMQGTQNNQNNLEKKNKL